MVITPQEQQEIDAWGKELLEAAKVKGCGCRVCLELFACEFCGTTAVLEAAQLIETVPPRWYPKGRRFIAAFCQRCADTITLTVIRRVNVKVWRAEGADNETQRNT